MNNFGNYLVEPELRLVCNQYRWENLLYVGDTETTLIELVCRMNARAMARDAGPIR